MFKKEQINISLWSRKSVNLSKNRWEFLKIKRFYFVLLLVSLFMALTAPNVWTDTQITGVALPGLDGVDKGMLKLLDTYNFPGAALAVTFDGKLILARGYGYAKKSFKKKIPVQPHSRFRLGSLSKSLTATAIMLLIEDGKLSLDDKMILLLQDLAPQKVRDQRVNQITVRHLLEHRGGFGKERGGIDPMFLRNPPCPGKLKSFLAKKLVFTPGEKYDYSNIGYCILGRIIEKATKMAYGDFVKARVLEPAGAHDIELGSSNKTKPNEVTYYAISSQPRGPKFNLEANDADGGWIGSTVDYLKFLTAIDGQRPPALLHLDTFRMMLAKPDDPALEDKIIYYAKGLMVKELPGGDIDFFNFGATPPGALSISRRHVSGYGWVALFNRLPREFLKTSINISNALAESVHSVKEPPVGDLFDK